jgi:hypothetical protein
MDDDGTYLRHIHLINWLRVMRPAAEYVGSTDDNKVFLPAMRKPRSKLAETAAFTRAAVALPVAEAPDPDLAHSFHRAQVVIMRRSVVMS